MKHSKRFNNSMEIVNRTDLYDLPTAVEILKETATAKFDESIDISVRLGVDPRKADQMVRGTVLLPSGTGKSIKICVLTKGDKEKEALDAGADFVGSDDLIKKIQEGWLDFDIVIATPDIMGQVGKLGRVLGPRGLMPNPKVGTVTFEIGKAVEDAKAGKIDFRVDKYGNLHSLVGKGSFSSQQLLDNIRAFMDVVNRLRPASAKGVYIKNITLSSTMGPGIKLDKNAISETV